MGFEFVEFASPTPDTLEPVFEKLGFTLVANTAPRTWCCTAKVGSNFIVNREPNSAAAYFAAEHGPSACGMAFRVKDAHQAYARALELGAQPLGDAHRPDGAAPAGHQGHRRRPLYLIDRFEDGKSIYDIDFEFIEAWSAIPRATA
jgi:4-hydroxyphenylpyruvate dioxygenase